MSPLGRWTADSFLKLYVRLQWKRTFPSRTLFGNVRPNPAIEGEYLNGRKHPPNRSFTSGGY